MVRAGLTQITSSHVPTDGNHCQRMHTRCTEGTVILEYVFYISIIEADIEDWNWS